MQDLKTEIKMLVCTDNMDPATIPLREALKALCCNQYVMEWDPKKSIFKLFYLLCLPLLKETLDTIQLLASSTGQVQNICFICIVEGELVQLTALLMVAKDKLMVSAEGGLENTPVQYIMKELGEESDQEIRHSLACSSTNSSLFQSPENWKINYMAARDIVRTLWRAVDVLEKFHLSKQAKCCAKHEVPFLVASQLFMEAKLLLKPKDVYCDHIEWFSRYIYFWENGRSQRKSAVRLVLELCEPRLIGKLEVVRLLAQNTKEVKNELFSYLMDGKMVEVGAILLVAREQLLPFSFSSPEGKDCLQQLKGDS